MKFSWLFSTGFNNIIIQHAPYWKASPFTGIEFMSSRPFQL